MARDLYDVARLDRNNHLQLNTWSSEDILNAVGRIQVENAMGADIWVRPSRETQSPLILVETTHPTFDRLRQDGFGPALVVQPRADLLQSWIKTDLAATTAPQHAETTRLLRTRYPHQAPLGSNPFSRLAGFRNWRVKGRRPSDPAPLCMLESNTGEIASRSAWLKPMALKQSSREEQEDAWNQSGMRNKISTALDQSPLADSDIWDTQPIVLIDEDEDPTVTEQEFEQETGEGGQAQKGRKLPKPKS